MLLDNKRIAIVGGGPGGLALARLLQMAGAEVHVYERDESRDARAQGATLDLHEGTGLEALKRAGLLEEFYKHHRPEASKMLLVNKQFEVQFDEHRFAAHTAETRPEIDRAPLRSLLLNALREGTVVWNSHFRTMEQQGAGWQLHFANGSSAHADLVIGADGASSKIRPYLTSIQPVYSGITLIEGNVPDAARHTPKLFAAAKGGKVMAFDNEQFVGYGTKSDGSIMFVLNFKTDEDWVRRCGIDFRNQAQVLTWFRTEFAGWSEAWLEFFTNEAVYFIPRPQYYYPLDQHWEARADLTLLGDAAHWMPPYAGEGANVALQDAFELADCLAGNRFGDLRTAIAHYEKEMLARGAAATRDTLENAGKMFAKDALAQMTAFFGEVGKLEV